MPRDRVSEYLADASGPTPWDGPGLTSTAARLPIHCRWMIRRDFPEVLPVAASVRSPHADEETLLRTLRIRNHIGMVAEAGDRIVGYMAYGLEKTHIEILDFAVAPDRYRRRIGRQMMAKLKGKLSPRRRTKLVATVRESALDLQLFLKAEGFLATGVVTGHCPDTGEDGYEFAYRVGDRSPYPPSGAPHVS